VTIVSSRQTGAEAMRHLKLTVAYDGTDLVGWQRQRTGVSVQGLLEDALTRIDGAPVQVHGAGRTDAGVHALAQVASARVTTTLEVTTLARALNAHLPRHVRVTEIAEVAPDFHARFSATGKTYRYFWLEGEIASPFLVRYVWHVPRRLDLEAMDRAARLLVGTHDFSAFQSTGSTVTHAVRTVKRTSVRAWTGDAPDNPLGRLATPNARLIAFEVQADGFLRHMVRAIAGTLAEIGEHRRAESSVSAILDGRMRAAAGITAPAGGLWLVSVNYC
jgi:tRNA pseudouridine38-40 synthase